MEGQQSACMGSTLLAFSHENRGTCCTFNSLHKRTNAGCHGKTWLGVGPERMPEQQSADVIPHSVAAGVGVLHRCGACDDANASQEIEVSEYSSGPCQQDDLSCRPLAGCWCMVCFRPGKNKHAPPRGVVQGSAGRGSGAGQARGAAIRAGASYAHCSCLARRRTRNALPRVHEQRADKGATPQRAAAPGRAAGPWRSASHR